MRTYFVCAVPKSSDKDYSPSEGLHQIGEKYQRRSPSPLEGEGRGGGVVTDGDGRHPPSALPPQGGKESPKTRLVGFSGTVAMCCVCANLLAMDIPTEKADVTLVNDQFEMAFGDTGMQLAVGDFNGDGMDDVAISFLSADSIKTEVDVVLGGTPASGLVEGTALRILTPPPFGQRGFHQIGFGDIDHDGKDDLFIAMQTPAKPGVAVLFGRAMDRGAHGAIDLNQTDPDLMVEGGFMATTSADVSFTAADFTGDGTDDLVVGIPISDGYVYLIAGRTRADFSSVLDPSTDPQTRLIKGPHLSQLGSTVFSGNVIGNGAPDLILSARSADFDGRTNAGKIFVIQGGQTLPLLLDLGSSSATAEIRGASLLDGIYCSGVGDMNGDNRGDLLLNLNQVNAIAVMDGFLIENHPLIDLNPSSPNYFAPALLSTVFDGSKGAGGDFDGDGLIDIFVARFNAVQLFPSSEETSWPTFPPVLDSPWTFQSETGYLRKAVFGDFNGDGFDDLVMAEEAHGDSYWGALHIIYGFKPLKSPHIHMTERTPTMPRVTVTLSVDGAPMEMKLTGDITDPFKDQWIPYQPSHAVTLTPAAEGKNVSVVFRNAFKRESEPAKDTVTLTVENQETDVGSNLVTLDQSARVECRLPQAGHLKATIYSRTGQKVVDLVDEDRNAGIWPVEWDGTNRDGRRVAPGVYVMLVDAGDHQVRTKILVKE